MANPSARTEAHCAAPESSAETKRHGTAWDLQILLDLCEQEFRRYLEPQDDADARSERVYSSIRRSSHRERDGSWQEANRYSAFCEQTYLPKHEFFSYVYSNHSNHSSRTVGSALLIFGAFRSPLKVINFWN
jgi:hypothetical protein